MEILNGTDLLLYTSADQVLEADPSTYTDAPVALGHATSHSISFDVDTRETSDKKTGAAKTYAANRSGWTGSAGGFVIYADGCDYFTLMDLAQARAKITVISARDDGAGLPDNKEVDAADGNPIAVGNTAYYQGLAILTNVTITADDQANGTYTITFQGTGELTPVDAVAAV